MKRKELENWLRKDSQKRAIAKALTKPMTATQNLEVVQRINPKVRLRDIPPNMRKMEHRGLVVRLYKGSVIGTVYFWTDNGRKVARGAFGTRIPSYKHFPAKAFSYVVVGLLRTQVLAHIEMLESIGRYNVTVSEIMHNLNKTRRNNGMKPVALSTVYRTVKQLLVFRLINVCAELDGYRKVYCLTRKGRMIVPLINKFLNNE